MDTDELLDPLTKQARVAVACCCIEHVADLYRKSTLRYPASAAAQAHQVDPASDLFDATLEVGWAFAETGSPPDPAKVTALREGTSELPPGVERDDAPLPALEVLDALESMLAAIADPTPDAGTTALETCVNALGDMIDSLDGGGAEAGDRASEQEEKWQATVIERAERTQSGSLARAAFADLIAQRLPWQRYLKAYEASM